MEPDDYASFRDEFKHAEIKANHENIGVYIYFRGERTIVEPNLPEMTPQEIDERLMQLIAKRVS